MQFRLLGPVEIEDGDRSLALGSGKQRALLAILLLHRNELVSRDRLIYDLWGERPPASAPHSLEVYVSRLRKTLHANGGDRLLLTRAGGYELHVETEQLDVACFERLAEEGRGALAAGNYGRAAERFSDGLALWRGSALGDLAYEPFARAEIERLEEQRIAVLEDRIEADLALGHHAVLISELEALTRQDPLRERLHGQLMLALYRCGRQADALEAYQDLRRHLRDEVGLDPSPALQRLEQGILRQDPALELPLQQPPSDDGRPGSIEGARAKPARARFQKWRPALGGVAAGGLLIGAVAVVVFLTGGSDHSLAGIDGNAVGMVDPKGGKIRGESILGATPTDVASGAGSIWLSSDNQTVSRIDPKTGRVVQSVEVGNGPSGIAYSSDGHAAWVANSGDGTVSRIDQGTNRPVDTPPVGNVPVAVAAGYGSIWVTDAGDRSVTRLDAKTGRFLKTIPTGNVGRGIAVGGGSVWVSDDDRGRVSRIDPRTSAVTGHVTVGNGAAALAYGEDSLWVANALDRTVMRVDPKEGTVIRTIPIGGKPAGMAFADNGLWVSDENAGQIVRIDPERNEVVARVETGNRPEGIAFAGGRLWVAVAPSAAGHTGGTLRIVAVGGKFGTFDHLDPALGYGGEAWGVLNMLYDGLTGLQRVGNPDGTKLVPDLATSLPAVSDDGRTYVFHLRPDIHYSNGQLVRPRDFRYGLERMFALNPLEAQHPFFYDSLRGAGRCIRKPKRCDLSAGVVTDDAANTITYHLTTPDPEFLQKLAFTFAAPVPKTTPKRETIVPTTGPYRIARYQPGRRLELTRNPSFHEWSQDATPGGYPDRMSWTFLPDTDAVYRQEVRAVEQGRADVAQQGVPSELAREVETQYAPQVHTRSRWGVTYVFLNTRTSPFNDVRARRAANYAANRLAALPASAQGLGGQPTCQILPPNFPGFRRYCPYSLHPTPSGAWRGPDLAQARRLVVASGTKGARVTIWVPPNQTSVGPIAASMMHTLGYRTRLENVSVDLYYGSAKGPTQPGSRVQAGVSSWFADYPAAPSFIDDFFSCNAWVHFCDDRIAAEVRKAHTLPTTDPYAANLFWAKIDHAIVDRAPVVPLITHKSLDFVSKRVGNYESDPLSGVLLDQLWVR
jgi:ABC-type transport system substrate-binding protein/DNA-binding SARP family transcriptional activator/streptogramin lyase